ncbi:MAG: GNAT family N-acetyltransferase [Petrimonas sp.]|nr:GNAT family N-acetyltransferase [Petrimonas sp.]
MEIKQIKEVTDELVSAMATLVPLLAEKAKTPSFSDLQQITTADGTFFFVAEENGVILGTLTLVTYRIPTGKKAWIEDVVVEKNARGKGIGNLLLEHAMQFAAEQGIPKIDLTSNPTRVAANELYKKIGFQLRDTNVYRYEP